MVFLILAAAAIACFIVWAIVCGRERVAWACEILHVDLIEIAKLQENYGSAGLHRLFETHFLNQMFLLRYRLLRLLQKEKSSTPPESEREIILNVHGNLHIVKKFAGISMSLFPFSVKWKVDYSIAASWAGGKEVLIRQVPADIVCDLRNLKKALSILALSIYSLDNA